MRSSSGQRPSAFLVGMEVVRRLVHEHGATVVEYDVRGDEGVVDLRLPLPADPAPGSPHLEERNRHLRNALRARLSEQRALLAIVRDQHTAMRSLWDDLQEARRQVRPHSLLPGPA